MSFCLLSFSNDLLQPSVHCCRPIFRFSLTIFSFFFLLFIDLIFPLSFVMWIFLILQLTIVLFQLKIARLTRYSLAMVANRLMPPRGLRWPYLGVFVSFCRQVHARFANKRKRQSSGPFSFAFEKRQGPGTNQAMTSSYARISLSLSFFFYSPSVPFCPVCGWSAESKRKKKSHK